MNKQDLASIIAEKTNTTKKQSEVMVNAVIDTIAEALISGDKVMIAGFGGFEVKELAARKGHNPKTGEVIEIAASKSVAFKVGKTLKDQLN